MLRVIFYHVGKGDMSLVLMPNGAAMLVDCYKAHEVADAEITDTDTILDSLERHIIEHREMVGREIRLVAEQASREQKKESKIAIDVLAITHADRDHIISRENLKARFDIGQLIDSGRDYADPSETQKDYMAFRDEMRMANKYIPIRRARANIWPASGTTVDVICPNRDIDPSEDNNNQCLILRVVYQGKRFLFTGDSTLSDWIDTETGILVLHEDKVEADILNVSHHGSRTFFTPSGKRPEDQGEYKKEEYNTEAIIKISPVLSFITCSDDENADHPDAVALEIYQEKTNPKLPKSGSAHVILSRDSQHLHQVVDDDGLLYIRTSRSRCNSSNEGAPSGGPYLLGKVSSPSGYLHASGIWVSRASLESSENLIFSVEAKGKWNESISFDWWVLNNGQGQSGLHREFFTMDSKDRKKLSSWSRPLSYEGVHIMQCYAYSNDLKSWANWCVLVCQEDSLPYALRWIEIFPNCIDVSKINRR